MVLERMAEGYDHTPWINVQGSAANLSVTVSVYVCALSRLILVKRGEEIGEEGHVTIIRVE